MHTGSANCTILSNTVASIIDQRRVLETGKVVILHRNIYMPLRLFKKSSLQGQLREARFIVRHEDLFSGQNNINIRREQGKVLKLPVDLRPFVNSRRSGSERKCKQCIFDQPQREAHNPDKKLLSRHEHTNRIAICKADLLEKRISSSSKAYSHSDHG